MQPFTYEALPQRVVFGTGTLARLSSEVSRLGRSRAFVLTTPPQAAEAQRLLSLLGPLGAGHFAGAVMHTPTDVTEEALRAVSEAKADCLVAVGGGSTIGLAKALALRTGLDHIAVPTTYAGSECTTILGETAQGRKTTIRDKRVVPEVVLYDVALTLSLPPGLTASSGMNALAHAIEALYAPDGNPLVSVLAERGVAALAAALPVLMERPEDEQARSDALFGAWACGTCLGSVSMGLHHKLCHVLGGSFGLPHAETHAVVLPYALAYNAPGAPDTVTRLGRLFGGDPVTALYELGRRLGLPVGLRGLGMPETGLDDAADQAAAQPYPNPVPLERGRIRALLGQAFTGARPG